MVDDYRHWDKVWKGKRVLSDYNLRWYDYLRQISKRRISPGSRVLETGSGSGDGIAIFADDGHKAFGLDVSKVAVEKASARYGSVTFICKDLFEMPFGKGEFDLIFNSGLIEHFRYPDNIKAISIMADMLRPGGRLIISVPNSLCLWYVLGKKFLIKAGRWPYGFEDSYSPALFKRYISEVPGLNLKRIFGLQALPMLATGEVQFLPLAVRGVVAEMERFMPLRCYYSYAIVAEAVKEEVA